MSDKVLVIREADNQPIEIERKYLRQQLRRSYKGCGFRLAESEGLGEEKEPEPEPPGELECGICGFKAKSTFGLKSHKRKHD